jgi:hypothetical protein
MSDKKNVVEKKKIAENLIGGKALNLIPPMTEREEKVEVRKSSLNMSAALALLFLFVLSIGIVGFNLFSKLDLNNRKEELFDLESDIRSKSEILSSNDEIIRRVKLFRSVEETTYYSRDVIAYWEETSQGLGTITQITLSEGMNFQVSGTSRNLTDVSKLWYTLGNDSGIDSINLRNVNKTEDFVRFNFEGRLNFSEFARNARAN